MKKMKRILSVLFAVLMVATLLTACGAPGDDTESSPSGTTDSDTPSGESTPSSDGADADGTAGYLSDDFDHFSRDRLKIAYICNKLDWMWNAAISGYLEDLGETLNYDYTAYAANYDYDAYMNQIEILSSQGYTGFVAGIDDALALRTYEVCTELGVAFIAESTPFIDENGADYWTSVIQDQYNNGAECVKWLAENYKTYWGDIDTSKLGLLVLDFSSVSGIHEREPGCKDQFESYFPEAMDNYIVGDLVSIEGGFSAQGGNTLTGTMLATHPEIEHWFIVGLVDDWALGATRAVESMGMEDNVLVTSVQADAFLGEMENGYTGDVYVSACAVSSAEFAINMASNLVTILEGRATAETIWPEWKAEGSDYACMKIKGTMITKDTYQEFVDTHQLDYMVAQAQNG